jgi:hypothetical protein
MQVAYPLLPLETLKMPRPRRSPVVAAHPAQTM